METLLQYLIDMDSRIFLSINGMHAPYWDSFMFLVSGKVIWIPLYATLLFVLLRNFSYVVVLKILLAIGLVILFTDTLTSQVIRPAVGRLRPCNLESSICGMVHIVDGVRGGRYGFPSAHAGNCFGLSFFICYLLRRTWLSVFMIVWALLVCYSRMYLGVHYFGDVFVGMLFALFASTLSYQMFLCVNCPCHDRELRDFHWPAWMGLAIFGGIAVVSIFYRV